MIVCDTHVLVHDALGGGRLSTAILRELQRGASAGELACSDASLWEMAQLIVNRRVPISGDPRKAIVDILATRAIRVLPIDADIAVTAAGLLAGKTDPFDRLIAATALVYRAPLISADERLRGIPGLRIVW